MKTRPLILLAPSEDKASGGVRTAADADQMIAAGATRVGARSSVAIVSGGTGGAGY